MSGIGQRLIDAREARGLTAADAARRLHIRTMFIEALEREDWRMVGDPVYARGFLKNYARLLGLDGDDLVAEAGLYFGRSAEQATVSAFAPHDRSHSVRMDARERSSGWLVTLAGAVAVVLVVLVVVSGIGLLHGQQTGIAPPESVDSPAPPAIASTSEVGQNDVKPIAVQAGGVDLRIAVTQPCWLSVTVDGKRVLYNTLPTGAVREFRADREISLRAGNAGGVVATIDGKDIGSLGRVGQVEDRVFAIATPASAPSSGAQ